MNNSNKIFSVLLIIMWPFAAFFKGIINFDKKIGKFSVISFYAFLGFTAVSVGDLERYEQYFYESSLTSFSTLLVELISLQTGKFYNTFVSIIVGSVFESHHYYFSVLFLIYGYFYINTVFLLKDIKYKDLNFLGHIFFGGLFLFLLVRPTVNIAFYTGGVFILYIMIKFYLKNENKLLFLLLLAPLFHIGLSIYLLMIPFLLAFKNKTNYYIYFVLLTFAVGQSSVVGAIEGLASSNTETVIESKFKSYASDEGQSALDERYSAGAQNHNFKLRTLLLLQDIILKYIAPLGVIIVFLGRRRLIVNQHVKMLFHITLLFWGISNLMLNISQGERFTFLFAFIATSLFYVIYINSPNLSKRDLFSNFVYISVPLIFLFGIMSVYATNPLFSNELFVSNFFIEFLNY